MLSAEAQKKLILQVYDALKEKGYNPVNQLIGYLLTEDPTYITNHNGARLLVRNINRDNLLREILIDFIEKEGVT